MSALRWRFRICVCNITPQMPFYIKMSHQSQNAVAYINRMFNSLLTHIITYKLLDYNAKNAVAVLLRLCPRVNLRPRGNALLSLPLVNTFIFSRSKLMSEVKQVLLRSSLGDSLFHAYCGNVQQRVYGSNKCDIVGCNTVKTLQQF